MAREVGFDKSGAPSQGDYSAYLTKVLENCREQEQRFMRELQEEVTTIQALHERLSLFDKEIRQLTILERNYGKYVNELHALQNQPNLGRKAVGEVMEKIRAYKYLIEQKINMLVPRINSMFPTTVELHKIQANQARIEELCGKARIVSQDLQTRYHRLQESSYQAEQLNQQLEEKTRIGFR